MKKQTGLSIILATVALLAFTFGTAQADPMGTAFTYQGRLMDNGQPANGNYDFEFRLYDAVSSGAQVGSTLTQNDIQVTQGLFTVVLDFGPGRFTGDARWLEIKVRPDGSGVFVALSPRQLLTPTPYAIYAPSAGTVGSVPWTNITSVPAGFADGIDNDTQYSAGTGLGLSGGQFSLAVPFRLPQACTNNYVPKWNNATGQWVCAVDSDTTSFWGLNGSASTNPASNFIGTTDNQALEFRVNNLRALRIEPHATSPNIIGGYSGNSVYPGVWGASIGGGGYSGNINRVTDSYGTIGGGASNIVGNSFGASNDRPYATVGGGFSNTAEDPYSTVGGGESNNAYGYHSTIAGGVSNQVASAASFVGGGDGNTAIGSRSSVGGGLSYTASGQFSTVPGGRDNTASGDYSFAAGRRAKADDLGCFVWADSTDDDFTCSWDNQFRIRANGGASFVVDSAANEWVRFRVDAGNLIDTSTGARLTIGGVWTNNSDRNRKENFSPVDSKEILLRLIQLPIAIWNYRNESSLVRRLGPVAQDFYTAFGFGQDDKHISTVDADGVALAAIQGLYQLVQEKDEKIVSLENRNTSQQEQIDKLQKQVDRISAALEGLKKAMTGSSTKFMVSSFNSGIR